jgi:hypothetical protein
MPIDALAFLSRLSRHATSRPPCSERTHDVIKGRSYQPSDDQMGNSKNRPVRWLRQCFRRLIARLRVGRSREPYWHIAGRRGPSGLKFIHGHRQNRTTVCSYPFQLAGVAADKAVEIIESHADRPPVERPGLGRLIGRRVVVLAEPRGRVSVRLQMVPMVPFAFKMIES